MRFVRIVGLSLALLLVLSFSAIAEPLDGDFYNGDTDEYIEPTVLRAIITWVGELQEPSAEEQMFVIGRQDFGLKIISRGEFYGQEYELENILMGHPLYDMELKEGQRVLLYTEIENGSIVNIGIQSYARDYHIYMLVGVFAITLLLVGGLKGLKALSTLLIMGVLIIFGLLPLMLKGHNPLLLAILFSTAITIITLFIIGGINSKSYSAIGGVVGGLMVAGVLALIFGHAAHLTGFSSEEAQMLTFIDESIQIDVKGLLFAGIIIGTLGAVLDVGMSTASSMAELKASVAGISAIDLFKAGMNVGRDIMGTMVNTLILAYTGSSLPLLLIFRAYETPYDRIINMDLIATEIVRSLVGSLGLILTIPLTAFFFILLNYRKSRG